MIVGEQKPISEILETIAPYKRLQILGCGTCVKTCFAGGEDEKETDGVRIDVYDSSGDYLASGGAIYLRDPHRKVVEEQLNGGQFAALSPTDWEVISPL